MAYDCSFLRGQLGENQVSFAESSRESHAADWGAGQRGGGVTPDAVVWPESTNDVSAVLSAANERGVPVTPYAAGTGLEGNAVPAHRGISMDLTRLNAVRAYRPEDFLVEVEPGLLGSAVNDRVGDDGLFFPPLPSSGDISTVGGMIATDASGMGTVKYGEVSDWVRGVEAVLADGTVISAGTDAAKTSAGYNLTDLVVGSEGTLAVVTGATLELAGIPEQERGGRAVFPTLDDAAAAVEDAVRSGVDVAAIELVDALSARAADAYLGTGLPDAPMAFVRFHADHGVEREVEFCRTVFEDHGVERFDIAGDDRMAELWEARKELAPAMLSFDPERSPNHPGDVTVPISRYADIVAFTKGLAAERGLQAPCYGHAGDGNLHYTVLVDPDDPEEVEAGEEIYDRVVRKAIDLGGTATGEHGIGQGKRKYLEAERGPGAVEAMRAVKRALDPNDTLNPGKIFPETADGERVRRAE